jgi:hypothetical protein
MRALLLAVALPLIPVDKVESIPEGGSICNGDQTHCIVNYSDWAAYQQMADENKMLRQMVKTIKCASVTVTEPSKLLSANVPRRTGPPSVN